MSNRLLWLLIIFWFILLWLLWYIFFFLKNNSDLEIVSNEKGYSVELSSSTLKQKFIFECPDFSCSIQDIPSISYDLVIKKWEFEDYREEITIPRNEKITKKITLKKIVFLKPFKEAQSIDNKLVQEKIEALRIKAEKYKVFDLWEKGMYFFEEGRNNKLSLGYIWKSWIEENDIIFVDTVVPNEINLTYIHGDTGDIFFTLSEKKYIFKRDENKLLEIPLDVPVLYVKKEGSGRYFLNSKVGTYIYENKALTYWSLFSDGIELEESIIGVVQAEDTIRKKNYSLEENWKSYILQFNKKTLEKTVLLEMDSNITKIYRENAKIYIEDEASKIYTLEWIQ